MDAIDANDVNDVNDVIGATTMPTSLKIELEWTQNGQPVRVALQVEGQGAHAQHVAGELSRAVTDAMLRGLSAEAARVVPSVRVSEPVPLTTTSAVESASAPIAPSPILPSATTVPMATVPAPAPTLAQVPSRQADATAPKPLSPTQRWFQANRTRINRIFGSLLLALALIVPLIVPEAQRRDVLVVTILFGLTGALLLFSALLPERNAEPSATHADEPKVERPVKRVVLTSKQAQLLRASRAKKPLIPAAWGLLAGGVFILTGLVAPFLLGATNADERFVVMLGFAPVTVVGFFMLAIFGRPYWAKMQSTRHDDSAAVKATLAPASGGTTTKRAPVSRVPHTLEFRALVPVAIVAVLVLMVTVVGLVIYATISSAVR